MKKRYFSIVYKETNEVIGIAVADTYRKSYISL